MLEIMVNGCNGKMGQTVCNLINQNDKFSLKYGIDKETSNKIKNIKEKPDVIIDFSIPMSTINILEYAVQNNIPTVIATTGFSQDEENIIKKCSKHIPIFKSSNMSYDIMLMKKLVYWLAPLLKNCDIEITETHHNKKKDSPSRYRTNAC